MHTMKIKQSENKFAFTVILKSQKSLDKEQIEKLREAIRLAIKYEDHIFCSLLPEDNELIELRVEILPLK